MTKLAVIVGSLRKDSISRKVANALVELAPASLSPTFVEIGDLPLYNEDLEADIPPAWRRFREQMRGQEAVLFVTPEYNRSVPGVLKNAIDVGSRPKPESVWNGKPCAIVSQSPGALSGFGANHHLRQMLVFLDMPVLQQPEAYLAHSATLFDEAGALKADSTRDFLRGFLQRFEDLIGRYA